MHRLTPAQRIKIVQLFYGNNNSVRAVYRHLRKDYGRFNRPTERTIRNLVKKFEETGSVEDKVSRVHHRGARSAQIIAIVSDSLAKDPELSIRRRSQYLGLSYGSLWRILHKDLNTDVPTEEELLSDSREQSDAEEADSDDDGQKLTGLNLQLTHQEEEGVDNKGNPFQMKEKKRQSRKSEEGKHRLLIRIVKPRRRNSYRKMIREEQENDGQWLLKKKWKHFDQTKQLENEANMEPKQTVNSEINSM